MKAIMTKYLPPGNVKGSRIKAFDSDKNQVILDWDHELDGFGNAQKVANALKDKMKWKGDLIGGSLKDGYVFVFKEEKPTIKYMIEVKKWFDKINGNTYHSIRIFDLSGKESKLIYCSGLTYGYGDQYRYTAMDFLIEKNLFSINDRFNHELIRSMIHFTVTDVTRKKDLDLEKYVNVM